MNSIKKQFSDLRKSTPKHIQWLLLAAAFIVVLILLTLLLTNKEEEKIENADNVIVKLSFMPDSINWANTLVGDTEKQTIKISANTPIKIMGVRFSKSINGLPAEPVQTCTRMGQIDKDNACTIDLEYKPSTALKAETIDLYVDWRRTTEPETIKNTDRMLLVLGATEPEPEKPAEPIVTEKEPVDTPVITETVQEIAASAPIKEEIKSSVELISPSNVVPDEKASPAVAPIAQVTTSVVEEDDYVPPAETCSDFAFPGYNLSGVQSGWIRPEAGAYYYHPFSDKECNNPTGRYNPDTGIITDINDSGKKIGTDAEHIGYTAITTGEMPQLSNPPAKKDINKAVQLSAAEIAALSAPASSGSIGRIALKEVPKDVLIGTSSTMAVYSSDPFDRKFVLRQYKPIPATIVSEVRADPSLYGCTTNEQGQVSCNGQTLPVRATVDRNVYSDDGRTVVIPTGTLLLGYVTGELPGPYKSIGRMQINWYQFILPNGVEFNFNKDGTAPFSGDSQGRAGVPGHGSTDYVEQIVMPMLTAIVPAAVNMIAPIADTFVNQIDLDNNTVVQSGTVRSSELAKNEIITAWNQVAQKLLVDAMDNTIPPFSIAAGTRITVFSPTDLVITCGNDNTKECSVENVTKASNTADERNVRNDQWNKNAPTVNYSDDSWVGQVRSFNLQDYCTTDNDGRWDIKQDIEGQIAQSGYDYRTVLAYCQSLNYQAINNAKQDALYQNQQQVFSNTYSGTTSSGSTDKTISGLSGITGSQAYNEEVLGLTYEDGVIQNPFETVETAQEAEATTGAITCPDGTAPDQYGCCTGEIYTDMGEQGFNCCPETGGDCFPPIM